jgi:hypothetical protein
MLSCPLRLQLCALTVHHILGQATQTTQTTYSLTIQPEDCNSACGTANPIAPRPLTKHDFVRLH